MAKWLVNSRLNEDRVYFPGEVVSDVPNAHILMSRGLISPVPDDFSAPSPSRPERVTRAPVKPAGSEGSATDEGSPGDLTLASLMELTREDLNELALSVNVKDAEAMANKRLVAEAILAANED